MAAMKKVPGSSRKSIKPTKKVLRVMKKVTAMKKAVSSLSTRASSSSTGTTKATIRASLSSSAANKKPVISVSSSTKKAGGLLQKTMKSASSTSASSSLQKTTSRVSSSMKIASSSLVSSLSSSAVMKSSTASSSLMTSKSITMKGATVSASTSMKAATVSASTSMKAATVSASTYMKTATVSTSMKSYPILVSAMKNQPVFVSTMKGKCSVMKSKGSSTSVVPMKKATASFLPMKAAVTVSSIKSIAASPSMSVSILTAMKSTVASTSCSSSSSSKLIFNLGSKSMKKAVTVSSMKNSGRKKSGSSIKKVIKVPANPSRSISNGSNVSKASGKSKATNDSKASGKSRVSAKSKVNNVSKMKRGSASSKKQMVLSMAKAPPIKRAAPMKNSIAVKPMKSTTMAMGMKKEPGSPNGIKKSPPSPSKPTAEATAKATAMKRMKAKTTPLSSTNKASPNSKALSPSSKSLSPTAKPLFSGTSSQGRNTSTSTVHSGRKAVRLTVGNHSSASSPGKSSIIGEENLKRQKTAFLVEDRAAIYGREMADSTASRATELSTSVVSDLSAIGRKVQKRKTDLESEEEYERWDKSKNFTKSSNKATESSGATSSKATSSAKNATGKVSPDKNSGKGSPNRSSSPNRQHSPLSRQNSSPSRQNSPPSRQNSPPARQNSPPSRHSLSSKRLLPWMPSPKELRDSREKKLRESIERKKKNPIGTGPHAIMACKTNRCMPERTHPEIRKFMKRQVAEEERQKQMEKRLEAEKSASLRGDSASSIQSKNDVSSIPSRDDNSAFWIHSRNAMYAGEESDSGGEKSIEDNYVSIHDRIGNDKIDMNNTKSENPLTSSGNDGDLPKIGGDGDLLTHCGDGDLPTTRFHMNDRPVLTSFYRPSNLTDGSRETRQLSGFAGRTSSNYSIGSKDSKDSRGDGRGEGKDSSSLLSISICSKDSRGEKDSSSFLASSGKAITFEEDKKDLPVSGELIRALSNADSTSSKMHSPKGGKRRTAEKIVDSEGDSPERPPSTFSPSDSSVNAPPTPDDNQEIDRGGNFHAKWPSKGGKKGSSKDGKKGPSKGEKGGKILWLDGDGKGDGKYLPERYQGSPSKKLGLQQVTNVKVSPKLAPNVNIVSSSSSSRPQGSLDDGLAPLLMGRTNSLPKDAEPASPPGAAELLGNAGGEVVQGMENENKKISIACLTAVSRNTTIDGGNRDGSRTEEVPRRRNSADSTRLESVLDSSSITAKLTAQLTANSSTVENQLNNAKNNNGDEQRNTSDTTKCRILISNLRNPNDPRKPKQHKKVHFPVSKKDMVDVVHVSRNYTKENFFSTNETALAQRDLFFSPPEEWESDPVYDGNQKKRRAKFQESLDAWKRTQAMAKVLSLAGLRNSLSSDSSSESEDEDDDSSSTSDESQIQSEKEDQDDHEDHDDQDGYADFSGLDNLSLEDLDKLDGLTREEIEELKQERLRRQARQSKGKIVGKGAGVNGNNSGNNSGKDIVIIEKEIGKGATSSKNTGKEKGWKSYYNVVSDSSDSSDIEPNALTNSSFNLLSPNFIPQDQRRVEGLPISDDDDDVVRSPSKKKTRLGLEQNNSFIEGKKSDLMVVGNGNDGMIDIHDTQIVYMDLESSGDVGKNDKDSKSSSKSSILHSSNPKLLNPRLLTPIIESSESSLVDNKEDREEHPHTRLSAFALLDSSEDRSTDSSLERMRSEQRLSDLIMQGVEPLETPYVCHNDTTKELIKPRS